VVPDITWIASAAPVSYVGATPVFADVDETTWCLSPAAFEACITARTKAVIPVDLYGSVADMDAIQAIATRHGIAVIEDAAEGLGSEVGGRKAGALGDVGVFSFHGTKTLTTGEGGMLVTDSTSIFERIVRLRDHGREPGDKFFYNKQVGFKYKMSALQAALGVAQLERIDELVAIKRALFSWYRAELEAMPGVTLNAEPTGTKNSYWMTTMIVDAALGLDKAALMSTLSDRGIETRPFFHPLSSLPAYSATPGVAEARRRNVVSYRLSPFGINLPSAMNLTRDDVAYVAGVVREVAAARNGEQQLVTSTEGHQ
jgi:perosamine synthetase